MDKDNVKWVQFTFSLEDVELCSSISLHYKVGDGDWQKRNPFGGGPKVDKRFEETNELKILPNRRIINAKAVLIDRADIVFDGAKVNELGGKNYPLRHLYLTMYERNPDQSDKEILTSGIINHFPENEDTEEHGRISVYVFDEIFDFFDDHLQKYQNNKFRLQANIMAERDRLAQTTIHVIEDSDTNFSRVEICNISNSVST